MDRVSVKASTSNGLGYIGNGEGIAAYAVVMIEGGK
jgi:2C-methyl-D-erythritol 2,4-cyclodiphosphate synthase